MLVERFATREVVCHVGWSRWPWQRWDVIREVVRSGEQASVRWIGDETIAVVVDLIAIGRGAAVVGLSIVG